ncbi:hypothetical protein [Motilimonas sp. KMU-193]|uniref:hypothetical protein n=1 Tax=Motilimonas sp. KMU-193 TaxID=3388668 RepID=UPI00396AF482
MTEYFLLGALYFALICAIAAHKKNRHVLLWSCCGALGGLLTFTVLITSANVCRQCHKGTRASYCPHCGCHNP